VDVIEDVGIAYGFNNVPISLPTTVCTGAPLPVNQFSDLLRIELANAGFMEMLTHGLCSTAENFSHLQHKVGPAVSLSNPANVEYEVVRTTLIPGALKTLAYNESLSHKNGIRLFEISDVVIPCNNDVGARNERHVVALVSALTSEFEVIHGIADRIMTCVQIQPEARYGSTSLTTEELNDRQRVARSGVVYSVRASTDECYFQGMRAEVVLRWDDARGEQVVGTMGVVHPSVLDNFGITYPCSLIEINLELLM
jgi:phenylalanyl-tRNA synthetase beta chain